MARSRIWNWVVRSSEAPRPGQAKTLRPEHGPSPYLLSGICRVPSMIPSQGRRGVVKYYNCISFRAGNTVKLSIR